MLPRDHPRACGEYFTSRNDSRKQIGSPPRMRGILRRRPRFPYRKGITPAHAGNTCAICITKLIAWDHPRACGEYELPFGQSPLAVGSPPRMRGIPAPAVPAAWPAGITPAHAGNTGLSAAGGGSIGDHPRACGEYVRIQDFMLPIVGSPPRMRGIRHCAAETDGHAGITPAHAGNTPAH